MRTRIGSALIVLMAVSGCQTAAQVPDASVIIAMERAALDRWGNGDVRGYLDIMAPEVTYFDPTQDKRVDGAKTLTDLFLPFAGKIKIDRYEMLNPKVQWQGDAAILTFNIVNYRKQADGSERPASRWNTTEIYGRVNGQWRIVHSHFSYVKPELKTP